jgi:hypothetical protein
MNNKYFIIVAMILIIAAALGHLAYLPVRLSQADTMKMEISLRPLENGAPKISRFLRMFMNCWGLKTLLLEIIRIAAESLLSFM